MQSISLPQNPKYIENGKNSATFEILGCYPGYGTTLGNALRRVILSSLEGAAATSVKIKGVSHEFSMISGVMENMVMVVLNLKKIRFKMHGDEPVKVILKSKGEGEVKAGMIKCPSSVEVFNPDQHILTVSDKKTEIEMEIEVAKGLGYVPVEQQIREEKEIGVIALDAVYTPIRRVNYNIEDMRVGKRTDYNKITIEIETDGTISPKEAFEKAVKILIDQFSALKEVSIESGKEALEGKKKKETVKKDEVKEEVAEKEDPLKIKAEDLKGISSRTLNVLEANKIFKVKDIVKMSEGEIKELKGMGDKGIKEIKKAIGEFGLTLKQ